MHWTALNKLLGNIDIYWLDFILKGHVSDQAKILDVGCGEGRNIFYLLNNGYDVFGVDRDPLAIQYLRMLAKSGNTSEIEAHFQQMDAKKLLFPDHTFDVILSSAVLHFCESHEDFDLKWNEMIRVLKPGGYLFIRSMTSHFLLDHANHKINSEGMYLFPSGESRYLITENHLKSFIQKGSLEFVEPFKYVNVSGNRSMGVIILSKK